MPSTIPVYDDVNFRNQFPAFENTTIFPPAQLEGWWTMATAYINIDNTYFWGEAQLQLAVDLMCAHLAASFTLINAVILEHQKDGYIVVKDKKMDTEKVASDMNLKDESAPMTDADYASEDEAPKYAVMQ